MYRTLVDTYGYPKENVYYLFETPDTAPDIMDGMATKRSLLAVLDELAARTKPGPVVTGRTSQSKSMSISALVDTGAAYVTLPTAWREKLGDLEQIAEIEVELPDQSRKPGIICGPLRIRIGGFRPIVSEALFVEMQPDEEGEYQPLVGYIALEQAGAAVDMLGHRLVHVSRVDLR